MEYLNSFLLTSRISISQWWKLKYGRYCLTTDLDSNRWISKTTHNPTKAPPEKLHHSSLTVCQLIQNQSLKKLNKLRLQAKTKRKITLKVGKMYNLLSTPSSSAPTFHSKLRQWPITSLRMKLVPCQTVWILKKSISYITTTWKWWQTCTKSYKTRITTSLRSCWVRSKGKGMVSMLRLKGLFYLGKLTMKMSL